MNAAITALTANPHWLREAIAFVGAVILIGGGLLLVAPNVGG